MITSKFDIFFIVIIVFSGAEGGEMELVHCKELLQVTLPSIFEALDLILVWIVNLRGKKRFSIEMFDLHRKRCMDLVSFESEEEWNLVKSFIFFFKHLFHFINLEILLWTTTNNDRQQPIIDI